MEREETRRAETREVANDRGPSEKKTNRWRRYGEGEACEDVEVGGEVRAVSATQLAEMEIGSMSIVLDWEARCSIRAITTEYKTEIYIFKRTAAMLLYSRISCLPLDSSN